ncbi:unnamed protein product [Pocillopora meandrina]|uniref:Uncharacterized protein n=1 Tax=Pocillopora meandrina TaxID=46732 RepID=A0AAU9Y3K8_9CNID|nr:unnamed protein product [Pocillopora meandrina]
MCEDAQGNKYTVKAFNSSDNFLKFEELQVDPPSDESVEKLLQSCEEHRNFFQRMFDVLIKLTAEVGQQSKDNLNFIQLLSDFTMGLQQETITLFSKIESVPTQSQLSDKRHVDRAKELHKWKRHHEAKFKGFEKLMSELHQKTTGGEPNNRGRLNSVPERSSRSLSGLGEMSSRRYSESDKSKRSK